MFHTEDRPVPEERPSGCELEIASSVYPFRVRIALYVCRFIRSTIINLELVAGLVLLSYSSSFPSPVFVDPFSGRLKNSRIRRQICRFGFWIVGHIRRVGKTRRQRTSLCSKRT